MERERESEREREKWWRFYLDRQEIYKYRITYGNENREMASLTHIQQLLPSFLSEINTERTR